MIQAVFLDSDGVLVDTERMFYEATRDVFAEFGVLLPPETWARLYLAEGNKSPRIAAMLEMPEDVIREAIRLRDDRFQDVLEEGPAALPGVIEALTRLKRRVRLILVTGAARRHVDLAHRLSGCLPFFEDVVTQDDFERPKPHPDAYLTALARARLAPGEAIAIEDSPRGARSAVAAGLRCLIVPTPLTALPLCPPEAEIVPTLGRAAEIIQRGVRS